MKKALVSISLICYLVVSCGVVINSHYCMNRLASTQFFGSAKKICSKCGMRTKKSGCCHDELKVIKLQQDQTSLSTAFYTIPSIEAAITIPSQFIAASSYNVDEKNDFLNHSPPLFLTRDIGLSIQVFRI